MLERIDTIQSKKNPEDKFKINLSDIQFDDEKDIFKSDYIEISLGTWNGQKVAVKASIGHEKIISLKEEWKIMKKLALLPESSQHLIAFYGYIGDEIPLALVIEYMDCDLVDYIRDNTNRDLLELHQIALDTAYGLRFLHKNKFIHCDIKLDNIMLKLKRAKLIDFENILTKKNNTSIHQVGTEGYLAPEILLQYLKNEGLFTYTSKTDMFSYYVVLFCLYSGNFPYNTSFFKNEELEIIRKGPALQNNIYGRFPRGIADLMVASSAANPIFRCSSKKAVKALEEMRDDENTYRMSQ